MRWAAIALSAVGVFAIGAGMLGLRGHLVPQQEAALERAAASAASEETIPQATDHPVETAKAARVRPVAPDLVALPPIAPEELRRVEPRAALSRFGQPLPQRPKNHGRVYRPVIAAAGRVSGSGLIVTIAGVEVTAPDETCVDAQGKGWPCGVRARTAFRSFVRGRALACSLPEELTEKHYTVGCSLGRQDVGTWLVEHGWTRALPGGPYVAAGDAARAAGKGIFGMAPVITADPPPAAEIASPDADGPLSFE